MLTVTVQFGEGGANVPPAGAGGGDPNLAAVIRQLIDELTEVRTQYAALLAKLDLDTGVADENYATLLTPADMGIEKG
jgi:hypothetical protein